MKRILIVDDFQSGRFVLREKLQVLGYLCEEVENGSEALNVLQTRHFDLIITDNHMPVMTGLQMLHLLAERPEEQRPPVILLTGHPSNELAMAARRAGVCAVFEKPYDDQALLSEITRILNQHNGFQTSCQSSFLLSEGGET